MGTNDSFRLCSEQIQNALAVLGLLVVIALALFGVLNLVDRAQAKPVSAALQPRMVHPLQCDATVSQRGAGEKWKTRCYIRKESP